MESLATTSNADPHTMYFPDFVRPEIPRTLPLLARLEDERALLELALTTFQAVLAGATPAHA